ncbi:MAG TPA: hypothetical protein V6C91_13705 [Coleofasciculaceae cyanobacterium]
MMRFKAVAIASLLVLGGVTGCNQEEEPVELITPNIVKRKTPQAAAPSPAAKASPASSPSPAAKASPASSPSPAAKASPANSPKPAAKASPASSPKPVAKASPAKAQTTATTNGAKQTLAKLDGYLPAALNELKANDVAQAKQYAKAFYDNWSKNNEMIRGQVKKESQAAYKELTADVIAVNKTLIQPANPDKAKATAAVQSLSQRIREYVKSP